MNDDAKQELPVIGWREWVAFPELALGRIKAKVDTGARSSSLHALEIQEFNRDGEDWVRFQVQPVQHKVEKIIEAEARVLDFRKVRSSSGKAEVRPVIVTRVGLLGVEWDVELTLADRQKMGFRMLLGREAIRNRFVVHSGKSYRGGRPKRKRRRPSSES